MNDQLPDKTVLVIILSTLLLVFMLVFTFKSKETQQNQIIEWKDSSITPELISTII